MRVRASLLGLVLVLGSFCASAQDIYRLEANDRIEIWTSVEPSLRRTVTIGPDGWLSLPLAGHLKAVGLTAPELEAALVDRLKAYFKDSVDLTVMLQPGEEREQTIYVAGEVATPGAYPFRSGMTVMHSISVAGGLQRAADAASDEERSIRVRGDVARDTAHVDALAIRMARLTAEIEGGDLDPEAGEESPTLSRERQILDARRSEAAALLKAHDDTLKIRRQATETLRQQAETLTRRIDIAAHRLKSVSKLVKQGFANEVQQLELEGDIAELEGRQHELAVDILTAELDETTEVNRFAGSLHERRTRVEIELGDAERERETVLSRIADSNDVLEALATGASRPAQEAQPLAFTIVRTVDGRPVELDATQLTGIMAGDLIRVDHAGPANGPSASNAYGDAPRGGIVQ